MARTRTVTRKTEYNLGGSVTLDDLRAVVAETSHLDASTKVHVNAGDSQLDGSWCIITIGDV